MVDLAFQPEYKGNPSENQARNADFLGILHKNIKETPVKTIRGALDVVVFPVCLPRLRLRRVLIRLGGGCVSDWQGESTGELASVSDWQS